MKKKTAGIGSLAAITLTAGLFGIYLEPEPVSHLKELTDLEAHRGQSIQQGNGTGTYVPSGNGTGTHDVATIGHDYSGYYGPEIEFECEECDWIKEMTMSWIIDDIDDRMFLATINFLIKTEMISTSEPAESDPIAISVPMSSKKVAVKWFEGDISTTDYFEIIQRLVDAEAIRIVDASDVKRPIPIWIKNTAEAWASDSVDIDENEYLITVNFLILESMIKVPESTEPLISEIPTRVKKVAKSWVDGEISDFQYIRQLERLIDRGIIS